MIRVWVDAALQDDSLLADSASVLDWGRRRMAHFLQPRDFGDPDTDAVVLLALVDAFGVRAALVARRRRRRVHHRARLPRPVNRRDLTSMSHAAKE